MNTPEWQVEKDDLRIEIHVDDDVESPRQQYDCFGKIAGYHGRYDIFDMRAQNTDHYNSWEEWRENELPKDAIYLPVYAYVHGNIALSTEAFGDPWDSGQLGYIFVTRADARENFMVKRLSKKTIEKSYELLKNEIQELHDYFNKDHYFYKLFEGDEEVDSLYGFMSGEHMVDSMADNWPQEFMVLKEELAKEVG